MDTETLVCLPFFTRISPQQRTTSGRTTRSQARLLCPIPRRRVQPHGGAGGGDQRVLSGGHGAALTYRSPPALSAPQGLGEDRALSMQSPAPPKPWERSGCPVAPPAASTPGSTATPSAAVAQSPAAQTSVAGPSQPPLPGLSTQYGGLASRYAAGSMYGGSPYGGSPYGGSMYGGGGMYGGMSGGMSGGMYGGMNSGMYGGGPFGAFGMNGQGDKDLPSGMRNIEQMLVPARRAHPLLTPAPPSTRCGYRASFSYTALPTPSSGLEAYVCLARARRCRSVA